MRSKMKWVFGLISVLAVMAAASGCQRGEADDTATGAGLDSDQATLVAALAANQDGSDEAWTSASGDEPFVVESCGFDAMVAQIIERFDSDGSGDLSEEELIAMVEEFGDPADRLQILMSVYDADDSGSLEASELDVVRTDLEARCENLRDRMLARFDTNGDGTLDAAEREAARAALRDRFASRHAARLDEFDRNRDGRLGPLERRRVGQQVRQRVERRRQALADQFDSDRNGELDPTERAALAAHLRQCVRGETPLMPAAGEEPAPDAGAGD
jgi:Ca2+-binding EF-hand superfamily protein